MTHQYKNQPRIAPPLSWLLSLALILSCISATIIARATANSSGNSLQVELTASPHGSIYYVSPTGDDDNPGTIDLPWRTIGKAASTLVAGDKVYIRAGTYPERLVPANSGAADDDIFFRAYPGETVTLDGTGISLEEWEGLVDLSGKSFLVIIGLRVINSNGAGFYTDGSDHVVTLNNFTYNTVSSGIGIWNSTYVTVDGNEVVLACNDGAQEDITIAGSSGFTVKNNHVHDGGPGSNGGEGIDIKDGSHDGYVYKNHVHHLNRVGIYVDSWDKHTYNIQVYRNLVHDVQAYAFAIASEAGGLLENVTLANNIAYHNLYVGLGFFDCCDVAAPDHPVHHVLVINNTFFDNGYNGWGPGISVENPDVQDITLRNNIACQNGYAQISVDSAVPTAEMHVDHNLVYGEQIEFEFNGTNFIDADPLFVNPAGHGIHLKPNSPAIDQGSATGAPSIDYDGVSRPVDGDGVGGAAWDMGAYEYYLPGVEVFLAIVVK